MSESGFVPVKNFEVEERDGALVCELVGGVITFSERDGSWFADISFESGRSTHVGPFQTAEAAAYYLTHGVMPTHAVILLVNNGILAAKAA